jgi:hypothetical protein
LCFFLPLNIAAVVIFHVQFRLDLHFCLGTAMLLPPVNKPNPSLLIIECGLLAITFAAAFTWPRLGDGWFARIERAFARLAGRKGLAAAIVGLSVLVLRLAMLPLFPVPLPFVPDDFSFLLAAQTFVHGRLTNPTPAMWTHFESIHITMLPSYQSMYFPGQGLLLATGITLFGHPWFALLAMDGLMCAALTWMLQAWLPPRWALVGGFIAVIRLGLFSDWINTYHTGGSLAALGGALMLGALPRLMKRPGIHYAVLMGLGVAILALTRPYEGMLLCLPVGFALSRWLWKGVNRPDAAAVARLAAAALVVVFVALAWLGYYDTKAFGKATTLPYTVDRAQYAMAPYYMWQHARPAPHYRYTVLRSFYQKGEMDFFNKIHTWKGFLPYSLAKVAFTGLFYAGFTLLLPLLMLRRVFLDERIRFLVVCVLVLAAGLTIEIYLLPHYVAPFVAAFYAIGLQAMRHLRLWKPDGKPVGLTMVRLTVVACVALAGLRLVAEPLHLTPPEWPPSNWNFTWFGPEHYGAARASIERQLEQIPGPQLAIVRYSSNHNPLDEWVYNSSEIDRSKVVWARDAGSANNSELFAYYRDRKVWLVEPDVIPAQVTPYPMPAQATVSTQLAAGLDGAHKTSFRELEK